MSGRSGRSNTFGRSDSSGSPCRSGRSGRSGLVRFGLLTRLVIPLWEPQHTGNCVREAAELAWAPRCVGQCTGRQCGSETGSEAAWGRAILECVLYDTESGLQLWGPGAQRLSFWERAGVGNTYPSTVDLSYSLITRLRVARTFTMPMLDPLWFLSTIV